MRPAAVHCSSSSIRAGTRRLDLATIWQAPRCRDVAFDPELAADRVAVML